MINVSFQTNTSIYVGAREVYVAQVRGTILGPRLIKFGRAKIQVSTQTKETAARPQQEQAVITAIKKVLEENHISARKVNTALAGKDVLIRYFQIPKIPRKEWESAVKFEAKKYIPFKIEELMWDFHVVSPKDKAPKMDVTFVAVKKELAKKHLSLLEKAGLKVQTLEPAPFGMVRLAVLANQLLKDKPTAIVDIDYGMADINIVKDRICYLTRDVSLPKEEGLIFDSLLSEIHMSLDYCEKLFPTETVAKVLICGAIELKDWDKKLAEGLKISVEKIAYTKAIKIRKEVPPLNMAVAIGLALHNLTRTATEVNLCRVAGPKPEIVFTKEGLKFTPAIGRAMVRAIMISGIGLLLLHLAMWFPVSQEKRRLGQAISLRPELGLTLGDASYEEMKEIKKELQKKAAVLNVVIDKKIFLTAKFNELPRIIPPGVWLTDLSLNESLFQGKGVKRSLTIRGMAYHQDPMRGIGMVTKFVSNLKENETFSRGFKEIKLDSMTSVELEKKTVKNFAISCSAE
jgi:Tfp pilus assembly protein PilN